MANTPLTTVFKYKLPDRFTVAPTFFVGLGGTGSGIVDRVLAKLGRRWDTDKFKNLCHGFAIDTDANSLGRLERIPEGNRILLSDFDTRWFVRTARGEGYLERDPYVTQWIHDWYRFREQCQAGAGQIRLESRLALHYQLIKDQGGIVERITRAVRSALDHDNAYRQRSPASARVFVFGSVAGGTGSGAFLPMAYLLRRIVSDEGLSPSLYAHVVLPGAFKLELPYCQLKDVDANGYAALKELEHLMALGLPRDGTTSTESEEFHFSPYHGDERVDRAPYNFVYLHDEPQSQSLEHVGAFQEAVSDTVFLQVFSPLFGLDAATWDNQIKKVASGTFQGYVLNYGGIGASVLVVPDDDILEYCARRRAIDLLDRFVLLGVDAPTRAAVAGGADDWRKLTEAQRAQRQDDAFVAYVESEAKREEPDGGPFTVVRSQQSGENPAVDLHQSIDRLIGQRVSLAKSKIALRRVSEKQIQPEAVNLDACRNATRQQIEESKAEWYKEAARVRTEIAEGRELREYFDARKVSALSQRYFLIKLRDRLAARIGALTAERAALPADVLALDAQSVVGWVAEHQASLTVAAPLTTWERLKRENTDFLKARREFVAMYNGRVAVWEAAIHRDVEEEILRAFMARIEDMLKGFRDLAEIMRRLRNELAARCEQIQRDGGLEAASAESNLHRLDLEVLRDERTGERMWSEYYEEVFAREPSYFDAGEVLGLVNASFVPEQDSRGRPLPLDTDRIATRLRDALVTASRARLHDKIVGASSLTGDRSQLGLLIDEALELEARIRLTRNQSEPPPQADVDREIEGKLAHAVHKSSVLCALSTNPNDASINPVRGVHLLWHPVYANARFTKQFPKASFSAFLDDPKVCIVYQTDLGVPLHAVRALNGRMRDAYTSIRTSYVERKRYPLHIDRNWEEAGAIADLDPEDAARASRQVRADEADVLFFFARAGDVVKLEPGADGEKASFRLDLEIGGIKLDDRLGATEAEAFETLTKNERWTTPLAARLLSVRQHLEGPSEPAKAWDQIVARFREQYVSAGRGDAFATRQVEAMERYLRRFAPAPLVRSLDEQGLLQKV